MKVRKIAKLYEQIHTCNRCFGAPRCEMKPDVRKVQRKIVKRAIESDIFIIGQALGGSTQRLSGLPYVSINGQLSRTGQALDNFLNSFGYTINPSSNFKYAYSSDIVQCYPGRIAKGDRKPTQKEVENCSVWFDEELSLITPTIILLFGRLAIKRFLKIYLNLTIRKMQVVWSRQYQFEREGKYISVFALPHPAYRWRNREEVDQTYEVTVAQIRKILL